MIYRQLLVLIELARNLKLRFIDLSLPRLMNSKCLIEHQRNLVWNKHSFRKVLLETQKMVRVTWTKSILKKSRNF